MRRLIVTTATALSLATIPCVAVVAQDGAPAGSAAQANAAVPPTTETTVTTRETADGPQEVVTTTRSNATPPPAASLDKDYPICRGAVQDGCQNPGEGGAPGRSRALDHWPGAPASEIKAQKAKSAR